MQKEIVEITARKQIPKIIIDKYRIPGHLLNAIFSFADVRDNLFVNNPVCVTSLIRFFDILKGNHKESNYLLHLLCNSIVVIDELQTYNPKHWDKILFFIENYASLFNMRFIIMSATLPKIDALSETAQGKFVNLTLNKKQYFINKNFSDRIELKKITGLMSYFTLSVYPTVLNEIRDKCDAEKSQYGYEYLSFWQKCYDINSGFNLEKARQDIIF
ncbi:MAG: hypothetical protein WDA19_11920 [Mariniphaga sp.]